MKKLFLILALMLSPLILFGQHKYFKNVTVIDSIFITKLATSDVKVLSPTSTGGTTVRETADGSEITWDSLFMDHGQVNNDLGIGITTPEGALHIDPTDVPALRVDGGSTEGDIACATGDNLQIGDWNEGTTTFTKIAQFLRFNTEARFDLTSGSEYTRLFFRDTDGDFGIYYHNGTSGTTKFRIDGTDGCFEFNGGNVGIGVSNPSEKLEVIGAIIAKNGFATKLWDVIGGNFETAAVGTEYYSPIQHGGIYGIIYRQYINTALPGDLTSGNTVARLIDYTLYATIGTNRHTLHGYGAFSSSDEIYIRLTGTTGNNNLSIVAETGWAVVEGWVDYTK